jgi:hypothetical protein
MKRVLQFVLFIALCPFSANTQITTPVIRANFGVDADLRSNFFNGFNQSGNDDWFWLPGSTGTGNFMIDTTGAAAQVALYTTNVASRRLPFFRGMRHPQFSVINNRLVLDAVMIRDYHGDDSTVFAAGSNKNGDSPVDWSCPVSQGIPDKNDILDMLVHVRRAGPNTTDSLWLFGGLSLDNTTGNRYIDFEMYQTDIYYDRPSQRFYGYGPDDGHTAWLFDAAGNITRPGDIIFTAEYQSASLTYIEARIWVHSSSLSMIPSSFNWGGQFDGAYNGAPYGYASISPKGGGTYYTGLQCGNGTWGGPFNIILQDNSMVTNYIARQFVEFSVNLTKLGLDPVTLLGGNACGMPFRRILVKTRASSAFTAELKDFVGPFDFFLAPRVDAETETPSICDTGSVAEIYVTNPVSTSLYQWSTPNGNIIGTTTGPVINVDTPGMYIVTHYLQAGCSPYAEDTVIVDAFEPCGVLANNLYGFKGTFANNRVTLNWKVLNNPLVKYFDIQRSTDGVNFTTISRMEALYTDNLDVGYSYLDEDNLGRTVFYRIRMVNTSNMIQYSSIIRMDLRSLSVNDVNVLPNPVRDVMQVQISSVANNKVRLDIFDQSGKLVISKRSFVTTGNTTLTVEEIARQPRGVYMVLVTLGDEVFREKILHIR